eukprot:7430035-Pyramimonas_sp.AAC.1
MRKRCVCRGRGGDARGNTACLAVKLSAGGAEGRRQPDTLERQFDHVQETTKSGPWPYTS